MLKKFAVRLARVSIPQAAVLSLAVAVATFAFGQVTVNAQPWTCGSCFYVYCQDPPSCENCGVYESWDDFFRDGDCLSCGSGHCIYRGTGESGPCAECETRVMQECLMCMV